MASSSAPPPPPNPGPGHVIPDNAIFVTDKCYCRPYLETDAEPSALLADDPAIARWMREAFPQPYTTADAQRWIATSLAESPMLNFAVVALDGTYVGGIGLKPRVDVERRTKELGYWLGRPHWGRGIATSAARGMARWAFDQFPDLLRLEAQAAAAIEPGGRVLGLRELFEDGPQPLGSDADAGVRHLQAHPSMLDEDVHGDRTVRGELNGVAEQVQEDLA